MCYYIDVLFVCVCVCVCSCRYASLYFCCAIEEQDNELITLEVIHRFVELLDKYFGSVCELDIIFNFEKAYFILDEFLMGGEIQDTSKKSVLKLMLMLELLTSCH
uniref:Zgc:162858 n=1 Tax=Seriola lalandi dorsalis TaxID=1841481 RepID=A0A3B4XJP1_SERLL